MSPFIRIPAAKPEWDIVRKIGIGPREGWGPRGRQLKGRTLPRAPHKCTLEGEKKRNRKKGER